MPTTTIDRNSPIPLYYQLKQIVLEHIKQRTWKPGDMIPSEQELQDVHNVSRTTVRQTLADLVNEGHLVRQQGRGTFVAEPSAKLSHNPAERQGITEYMLQQGITPGWQVLSSEWCAAPLDVAEQLNIAEGDRVMCVRRLRLADDEPIGYHIAYLPEHIAARIDEDSLTRGESLAYIAHIPQMRSSRASRTIEAVYADSTTGALLSIDRDVPILQITRVITNADEHIEYLRAQYRGDRFKYQIAT